MGLINGRRRRAAPLWRGAFRPDRGGRSAPLHLPKYRAIFSYFDALLVGLTATPKDEIDRNTYSLFGLESGVPTDAYGLDDAIAEGYLAPPSAISVPLKFQRQGIRYDELSDDEKTSGTRWSGTRKVAKRPTR